MVFHWDTSRGAGCLENVIAADFKGTIQCDGYAAYEASSKTPRAKSLWRDAGLTCGATSLRRATTRRSVGPDLASDPTSTESRKTCAAAGQVQKNAPPSPEPEPADLRRACTARWCA